MLIQEGNQCKYKWRERQITKVEYAAKQTHTIKIWKHITRVYILLLFPLYRSTLFYLFIYLLFFVLFILFYFIFIYLLLFFFCKIFSDKTQFTELKKKSH